MIIIHKNDKIIAIHGDEVDPLWVEENYPNELYSLYPELNLSYDVKDGVPLLPELINKEDLVSKCKYAVETEANKKVDATFGKSDRDKRKKLAKSIKLLLKKIDNTISPSEETLLETLGAIETTIDNIEVTKNAQLNWIVDKNRTLTELRGYSVNIINWE